MDVTWQKEISELVKENIETAETYSPWSVNRSDIQSSLRVILLLELHEHFLH